MSSASTLPTLVRRYSFTDPDAEGATNTIRVLIRSYSVGSDHDDDSEKSPVSSQSDSELDLLRGEQIRDEVLRDEQLRNSEGAAQQGRLIQNKTILQQNCSVLKQPEEQLTVNYKRCDGVAQTLLGDKEAVKETSHTSEGVDLRVDQGKRDEEESDKTCQEVRDEGGGTRHDQRPANSMEEYAEGGSFEQVY